MIKPEIMLKIRLIAEKSHGIELRLFCRLREGSKLRDLMRKNMPEKRLINVKSLNETVLKYKKSILSRVPTRIVRKYTLLLH
jgi:hypothetical protein